MIDDDDRVICNTQAISFIHVFSRVAIELNSFNDKERGGLLIQVADNDWGGTALNNVGWVVKHLLTLTSKSGSDEDNQQVENICIAQLIRLRQSGLLTKQDVLDHALCLYDDPYFPERRFRFLTEWNPNLLLLHVDIFGNSPLGKVIKDIDHFKLVFDCCIRFYPHMKGIHLLFRKNNVTSYHNGDRFIVTKRNTPFENVVRNFDRKKVMDIVEEILGRYLSTTPIQTANALVVAASEENIHLDCVYFLIRREPTILGSSRSVSIQAGEREQEEQGNTNGSGNDIMTNMNDTTDAETNGSININTNVDDDDDDGGCVDDGTHNYHLGDNDENSDETITDNGCNKNVQRKRKRTKDTVRIKRDTDDDGGDIV